MKRQISLTRSLVIRSGAIFVWMALLTGIFGFATDGLVSGIVWTIIGLAVVIILFGTNLIERLDGREIPMANAILIIGIIVLVGFNELFGLLSSRPTMTFWYLHNAVFTIVYLILAGLVISQFINQINSRQE